MPPFFQIIIVIFIHLVVYHPQTFCRTLGDCGLGAGAANVFKALVLGELVQGGRLGDAGSCGRVPSQQMRKLFPGTPRTMKSYSGRKSLPQSSKEGPVLFLGVWERGLLFFLPRKPPSQSRMEFW